MSFKEKLKRYATTDVWVSRSANPFRNKVYRSVDAYDYMSRVPLYCFLALSIQFCLMSFAFIFMSLEKAHEVPFFKHVSIFCAFIFLVLLIQIFGLVYTLIISFKKYKKLKQLLIVMAIGKFVLFTFSTALLVFFSIGLYSPTIILLSFIIYIITAIAVLICNIVFVNRNKKQQRLFRLITFVPYLLFFVVLIGIAYPFSTLILYVLILLILSLLFIITFNKLVKRVLAIIYWKDIKVFKVEGWKD